MDDSPDSPPSNAQTMDDSPDSSPSNAQTMDDSPDSPPSNAQTMDDGPDSPPAKLKMIQIPPGSPEDYVFDPTRCSGPKPPIDEELEHVPCPSLLEGFDFVEANQLHWPLNEMFPLPNQIHQRRCAQTMDDGPDSPPSKLKEIQMPPSYPEDYVFDPTLCSCPKPLPIVYCPYSLLVDKLEHVPCPSSLEGFDFVEANQLHWPLNKIFPFSNQIDQRLCAQTTDDSPDSPPSKLKEIQLAPKPEPDAHDNCSKYMRTASSRKATTITHTPTHTSTDSPQVFCWVHSEPKGPGLPPFPKSPPLSPDASPLIDSILERVPTEWVSDMKSQEDLERMKTAFLLGYDASFSEQTPPDIQLRPLDDETPMPAHKSILAARSKILGMADLDGSYGRGGIVELPESREELEPLLEFLYVGSLPEEKMQKHIMALFKAAYNYEIWYLWELCARHCLSSLISSNDLEVLYLAYCCRHKALLEAALKLIVEEGEERICCVKFINFANKYPLMLKLVRMALVMCRKTWRVY